MAFNEDEMHIGTVTIEIDCNEYPRFKEYCNGNKLAKIVGVETKPNYVGLGIATKLLKETIKKFKNYNLVLLCSPHKRWEDTDTLKTVADLQMFYSKFGFIRTNELLPTMILKAN
jgi:GNAT superfamily N-acetyltransferase